jgi:hypothetical protein
MFAGVSLFPDVLSKPLEFQNGEMGGIFGCRSKNMNDFLRDRPVFALRPCLNLSVQAIWQVLDIEGSHNFLQNAPSMEERTITVKLRDHGAAEKIRIYHKSES